MWITQIMTWDVFLTMTGKVGSESSGSENGLDKESSGAKEKCGGGVGTTKLNACEDNAYTIDTDPFDDSNCDPRDIPDSINGECMTTEFENIFLDDQF